MHGSVENKQKRAPCGTLLKEVCLNDIRPYPERVIYLRYDIALCAMMYALRHIMERILYHIFTKWKYIMRQSRISYLVRDISFITHRKTFAYFRQVFTFLKVCNPL